MGTRLEIPSIEYIAAANQTEFAIPFDFIDRAGEEITVLLDNAEADEGNWDIVGLPENAAIKVSYIIRFTQGLPANTKVEIYRSTEIDQQLNYVPGVALSAKQVLDSVDKLTRICQELALSAEDAIAFISGHSFFWGLTAVRADNTNDDAAIQLLALAALAASNNQRSGHLDRGVLLDYQAPAAAGFYFPWIAVKQIDNSERLTIFSGGFYEDWSQSAAVLKNEVNYIVYYDTVALIGNEDKQVILKRYE